jgi:hypothetical protein
MLTGRKGVLLTDNGRTAYPEKGWVRMAQVTLERILQELKTLKPEELLQVQQAVQAQLAPTSYVPAEE